MAEIDQTGIRVRWKSNFPHQKRQLGLSVPQPNWVMSGAKKALACLILGLVALLAKLSTGPARANPPDDADSWSKPVNQLQARVVLIEKPKINGTRWIVPYLELRNVSDVAYPLKVRCDGGHVRFALIGADGKVLRNGWELPRSGLHPHPGTIVLPFDSSIRIGMGCTNWGVPKNAPAMISTDSGAWVLKQQEKGKVFLRVTIKGEKVEPEDDQIWHGRIETIVKVDWKE